MAICPRVNEIFNSEQSDFTELLQKNSVIDFFSRNVDSTQKLFKSQNSYILKTKYTELKK